MDANILVVEDSDNIRLLVKTLLLKMKAKVTTVSNGLEALEHLNRCDNVDLILLDIMMPGMDGLRFLKNIKDKVKEQGIKVCMMTAKRDKQSVQTAISLGANDYIVKPVDKEILGEKIKQLLGSNMSNPFATVKVNIGAQLAGLPIKVPLRVIELSELEVKMKVSSEFEMNSEFSFFSASLSKRANSESNFNCKVTHCQKISNSEYQISATFIGLTEDLRTVLRQIAVNQEEINDER